MTPGVAVLTAENMAVYAEHEVPDDMNLWPAVLARVESARAQRPRRLPALWPVTPRLVIIIALTLLLLGCAGVAAYFLYPIPKGFGIFVTEPGPLLPGYKGDVRFVTAEEMARLTDEPAKDVPGSWSPDCSRLAFASNRDSTRWGVSEIYLMNPDGTGLVNLTQSPDWHEIGPEWSPDGARIAFTSHIAGGGNGVYVINADGTGRVQLSGGSGGPSWSPDGQQIVFQGSGPGPNPEVYVMNDDGTGMTNLSQHPSKDQSPRWSPDGTRIAFSSDRDSDWEPWVGRRPPPDHNYEIYLMNPDGSGVTRLTDTPYKELSPRWSPDGKWISFSRYSDGGWHVYVMKSDGSSVKHVTQGVGGNWSSCKVPR